MHFSLLIRRLSLLSLTLALVACATPMPRTDDPLQNFNRKVYAINDFADRVAIRPVAVGYRKITNETTRRLFRNFFANIESPITIVNDVLQANLKEAAKASGRLVINMTVGVVGLFDPASELGIQASATDFGVTLAKWGVPEGPYIVLPLYGSSTMRDLGKFADGYYLDPLTIYARNHDFDFGAQYAPTLLYLISLRSTGIEAEGLLEGVYDPYIFYRDAYRQRRLYQIYRGNPPIDAIQTLQGTGDIDDADKLIEEQQKYEKKQPTAPTSPTGH